VLRWAEAINENTGPTQEAIDLVNLVRSRAGMPALQLSDAAKPTFVSGQTDFRERIRNERRVEFPNEGVNYFDELRWGTWKTNKFYAGNGCKTVWGAVLSPYVWAGDYLLSWPVPTTVVQISNGAVAKTAGWGY
jgi:hypothetical protein